jgi:hypothetical protein
MKLLEAGAALAPLLETMDLPINRKRIRSLEDVRWLCRNMGAYNSKHVHYEKARTILVSCARELLKGSEQRQLGVSP